MMHTKVADFNGRAVYFTAAKHITLAVSALLDSYSSSSVLFYFGKEAFSDTDTERLFDSLLSRQPLAVTVAGKYAERYFDMLLKVQSRLDSKAHTMTYRIDDDDLEEVVWKFLNTSFPDDERFDDWKAYCVLSFEREQLFQHSLVRSIETFIEKH
jgi:hypothetical protein